jgi:hypothetical protein
MAGTFVSGVLWGVLMKGGGGKSVQGHECSSPQLVCVAIGD